MNTKHKYQIAMHGSTKRTEVQVEVSYPDTLLGLAGVDVREYVERFAASQITPGDPAEEALRVTSLAYLADANAKMNRIRDMFASWTSAHHVQSKLKSAFGTKPADRKPWMVKLIEDVEKKNILVGVDFIPKAMGQKERKDDIKVQALRKVWEDKLDTLEKRRFIADKFDIEFADDEELESLSLADFIAGYWTWKDNEDEAEKQATMKEFGLA
jgi:hypothetical protein